VEAASRNPIHWFQSWTGLRVLLGRTIAKVKEKIDMQCAMIYAFVVVAGAPFIGIWRGHVWARSNGKLLAQRKPARRKYSWAQSRVE
jgi:hypothetical protein